MQVTPEELATLIGMKDIEIMVLQKQIAALQTQLAAELAKPNGDGGVHVSTVGQTGGITAANVP